MLYEAVSVISERFDIGRFLAFAWSKKFVEYLADAARL